MYLCVWISVSRVFLASSSDLHERGLVWLGDPHVPVSCHSEVVLELSHLQVGFLAPHSGLGDVHASSGII